MGNYVDIYGFRHTFTDEQLALHYICTQLHSYYFERSPAQIAHRNDWKIFLRSGQSKMPNMVYFSY